MSDKGLSRRQLLTFWRRPPGEEAPPPPPPPQPPPSRHVRDPSLPAPLRPPGAIAEQALADACTRCNKCMEACPVHAIRPLPQEYGPWAGTPHIVPRQEPCVVCDGLLCIPACPTGALRPIPPAQDLRIGQAVIDPALCLPFHGTPCDQCAQNCPEPLAIQFNNQGLPRIDAYHCLGCGICEKVCPTERPAITVLSLAR